MLFGNVLWADAGHCKDYKSYEDVSLSEMKKLVLSKSAVILDVNSKGSYDRRHIPGAIHFASSKNKLSEVLPAEKDKLIVAYCGGKFCTAWRRAAVAACKLGYKNVKHFSPGIRGWKKSS